MKQMRSFMKSSSKNKESNKQNRKKKEQTISASKETIGGDRKKAPREKKQRPEAGTAPSVMGTPDVGMSTKNNNRRKKASLNANQSVMGEPREPKTPTRELGEVTQSPAASPLTVVNQPDAPEPEADVTENTLVDPEKEVRGLSGRDPDTMSPEQLQNLRAFIAQYETIGVKGLLEEFDTIKTYNLDPFDISSHESNPSKNRYKDIFCIEPSRVKLMDGKECDYVHANYVKGNPFMNVFITTQGPLEPTVNDFWRMVVQENVGYIFMLCSIVELGKKKCEQYFPETEGEMRMYLDTKVTLEWRKEDSHFINSRLVLEPPNKPKRIIYHHFWKNWPDRGVPITALAGLRLLKSARLSTTSTIVHCSAGVGRTGTLVAIEWMLQTILTTPPPYDMRNMLRAIRNQRAHAIQTGPQYAYIAFAVFRLYAILEPSGIASFHKFSQDMQTFAGVQLPPNAVPLVAAPPPQPPSNPVP